MNIRHPWVKLALLFLTAAVVGFAIPTTLAYLTAQSDTLFNTFTSPYFPPDAVGVEIRVEKTMYNANNERVSPAGFQFHLESTETGEYVTMITDASGHASITLPFTDVDVGKTYAYRLYEVNDGRENVLYDDTVYAIRIALSANADNQVDASVTLNGKAVDAVSAAFENTYSGMILPPTGDEANITLYAVLLIASAAGLVFLLLRLRATRR